MGTVVWSAALFHLPIQREFAWFCQFDFYRYKSPTTGDREKRKKKKKKEKERKKEKKGGYDLDFIWPKTILWFIQYLFEE